MKNCILLFILVLSIASKATAQDLEGGISSEYNIPEGQYPIAVSYTHLDVYKRQ